MNITEKVEQIRQKPEHIRLRYVWFFVSLGMAIVLIVWFFSVKMQMMQFDGAANNANMTEDIGTAINQFSQQGASIKDAVDKTKQSLTNDPNKNVQN